MANKLMIINDDVVSAQDQQALTTMIDRQIASMKSKRQNINRLVFDCVSALTEADDAKQQLANKGGISRFIGSITGSNKRLQDKINENNAVAQWAAQQTLKELADQNLMTFELVTAVNNKLNASVYAMGNAVNAVHGEVNSVRRDMNGAFQAMGGAINSLNDEMDARFSEIYTGLEKFFRHNRNELVRIDSRLQKLEQNVQLLNWQNTIEYQEFNGEEYIEMDVPQKIVCVVRDFYDITRGKWSPTDLVLLKATLSDIGLQPKGIVNYFDVLKAITNDAALQDKLLNSAAIDSIDDPSYLITMGALKKLTSLNTDERYLVDTMYENMRDMGVQADWNVLRDNLAKKYMAQSAQVNVDTNVEVFDLVLDFLYNLQQADAESILVYPEGVSTGSDLDNPELKEAEQLYMDYKLDEAFEKFQQLAEAGNGRAMYFLGEYYNNIIGDREKGTYWRKQGAGTGDVLATLNAVYSTSETIDEVIEKVKPIFSDVLVLAETGDVFAQNEVGDLYWNGWGPDENEDEAIKWYKKSAETGYWSSADTLGAIYYNSEDYNNAIKWIKQAAKQGVPNSQYGLGLAYYTGNGVSQNRQEAAKWLKKAAEQGIAAAQYNFGELYEKGEGVPQNYSEAAKWYEKSANQGYVYAQYSLAELYRNGNGVVQSDTKAAEWYQKAAEQGNVEAQTWIGLFYECGSGVAQNYGEAAKWYQMSAEQGEVTAQNQLADLYRDGNGVPQNYSKAAEWYQKAADQGDDEAQNSLGNLYYGGDGVEQNYRLAARYYYKSAEQGNMYAQNNLGNLYYSGNGVSQSYGEAATWYQKAAEQGDAWGQCNLAGLYENGDGVTKSYSVAMTWYKKAAEQGLAYAQMNLGWMYAKGKGVRQDYYEAAKWYKLAADQGDGTALNNLAYMYEYGNGVRQDKYEAERLYRKAIEQGNETAKENLDRLLQQ